MAVAGILAGDTRVAWVPGFAAIGYVVYLAVTYGDGAVYDQGDMTWVTLAPFLLALAAGAGPVLAAAAALRRAITAPSRRRTRRRGCR